MRDDPDDIAALLGSEGRFAREVSGFAPRQAQQDMARAVAEVLRDGDTLVAEAGTGTGKTFAYLVPALLSGKRVIISTGTKTLQEQLYFRDIPQVQSVLGLDRQVALLKGRANYLCLYRLDQAVHGGEFGGREEVAQLATIRQWAARTVAGDRMELAEVPENAPIWPRVTSTSENCLGTQCPFYDDCHVFKARRKAAEAQIVVVNHHLLFADMALRQEGFGELLPTADAFILDEAHQVPDMAGQFFSQHISARQLRELGHDALAECAGVSGALTHLREPVEALNTALKRLRAAMESLPARGAFVQLAGHADVHDELERVDEVLDTLAGALASQADRSRGLANVHERADTLSARLARIGTQPEAGEVRWYERSARGFALHATPLDLATPLQAMREASAASWIYTSATLSVAGRFDHFAGRLGLEAPRTLALDSPFDFAGQALCYLPSGLPAPGSRDYTDRVVEAVLPVLHASGGRAFLLFTSHRALRRATELLEGKVPWPLFVQGTAPRHRLLEDFRQSGNGVLLGAASFWEGVDVAGEALSVVVIDKLPFAAPDDPVLQARLEAIQETGGNPFRDWQVPDAVIALKQGAGRLIRSVHDRGVLVLCDPRLTGKGYGRWFLTSVPPMSRTQDLAEVEAFFATDGATIEP